MSPAEQSSQRSAKATRHALVSVIVAAFNAEAFIESTCLSALRQTYSPIEVIVVDDGSTDRTSEVVGALAASDPRIRLIRQDNLGVAAARNRAIAEASGEFIAPLDADDLWEPTKVARQVARLQESGSDTGLVYCWWVWIDADNTVIDRSPFWRVEGDVLERLVEVNFTGSASVPIYRRACLDEVGGYDSGLREKLAQGCEDWDLALRVAERYKVVAVPAMLVGYRRRVDSMSANCDIMWRSQAEMLSALGARRSLLPPLVLRRSIGQFALHLAGVSFWSGDYLGACRWALRARPLTLIASIAPHVARMLVRRLLPGGAPSQPVLPDDCRIDAAVLREPLIPYDRIYARHWGDGKRG